MASELLSMIHGWEARHHEGDGLLLSAGVFADKLGDLGDLLEFLVRRTIVQWDEVNAYENDWMDHHGVIIDRFAEMDHPWVSWLAVGRPPRSSSVQTEVLVELRTHPVDSPTGRRTDFGVRAWMPHEGAIAAAACFGPGSLGWQPQAPPVEKVRRYIRDLTADAVPVELRERNARYGMNAPPPGRFPTVS